MSQPYIGEIRSFAFGRAPLNWVACDGSELSMGTFAALYSLIGISYGGDGKTSFKVPDLRGRAMVGCGQMPDGGNYPIASIGGAEEVSLNVANLPAHRHDFKASTKEAGAGPAAGNLLARPLVAGEPCQLYATPEGGQIVRLAADSIASVGGGKPHPNLQPYMATAYYICTSGVCPTRG